MMDLCGKPVIQHVFDRLCHASEIDEVYVATSIDLSDDFVVAYCRAHQIPFFRGALERLLDRFLAFYSQYKPDHIVRITADCPLVDPKLVDHVVREHLRSKADYTSNIFPGRTYPKGLDVEVVSANACDKMLVASPVAHDFATRGLSFIRSHPENFTIHSVTAPSDFSDLRVTLDYEEDYRVIESLYDRLYSVNPCFGFNELISNSQTLRK